MDGVVGMMLGVPLCAALYRLLREDVQRRRALAAKPEDEEPEQRAAS